jgi:hypothetical protein
MTPDAGDYVRAIRQLPRPTLAQTERFARFVSGAHSWYKHLPIRPKVPFVFYLDPGAGMNLVRTRTGETALVEITDESTRFHYTWQKTEDYRRRFGHWNYHAAYGTSFLFAGEGGVVSTAGAGPKVLAESGDWLAVPTGLSGRGTAPVSALVHPWPNFRIWASAPERFGLPEVPEAEDAGFPSGAHPILRRLWRVIQKDRRDRPSLSELVRPVPPHLLEVTQHPAAGRSGETWLWPTEAGWDWPAEEWLEQLRAAGVEERLISSVVKYVEAEQRRRMRETGDRDGDRESPEWPTKVMVRLAAAVAEERGWQLAGMTEAMTRFAESIYG